MLIFINFAFANPELIVISLFAENLQFVGFNFYFYLPLFAVFFIGIIFGIMLGFFRKWTGKFKHRAEAYRKASLIKNVERQLEQLKDQKYEHHDEVPVLLEETTKEMRKSALL
jgi:lipopolysaccharide assembly protein A